jgi:hypothetical protein
VERPPYRVPLDQPVQLPLFDMREYSFLQGMASKENQLLQDKIGALTDGLETLEKEVGELRDCVRELQDSVVLLTQAVNKQER